MFENKKIFLVLGLVLVISLVTACSDDPSVSEFELEIKVEGEGEVEPEEGSYTYEEGTVVDLKAISTDDWGFKEWEGEVIESAETETKVLVDKDKVVTAVFEKQDPSVSEFELEIKVEGEGEVEPEEGSYTYEEGTVVDLKAISTDDWGFKEWEGEVEELAEAETKVLVDKDKVVTAVFNDQSRAGSIQELEESVANSDIDSIKLTADIYGDITIDRIVEIDFNNYKLDANMTIESEQEGSILLENGSITGNLIIDAGDMTVDNQVAIEGELVIESLASNSFNNQGELANVSIQDPDGLSFNNGSEGGIDALEVSSKAKDVAIANEGGSVGSLSVDAAGVSISNQGGSLGQIKIGDNASDVGIENDGSIDGLEVSENATGLTVTSQGGTISGSDVPVWDLPELVEFEDEMVVDGETEEPNFKMPVYYTLESENSDDEKELEIDWSENLNEDGSIDLTEGGTKVYTGEIEIGGGITREVRQELIVKKEVLVGISIQDIDDEIDLSDYEINVKVEGSDFKDLTSTSDRTSFELTPADYDFVAEVIKEDSGEDYVVYQGSKTLAVEVNSIMKEDIDLVLNQGDIEVNVTTDGNWQPKEEAKIIVDYSNRDKSYEENIEWSNYEGTTKITDVTTRKWDIKLEVDENILEEKEIYVLPKTNSLEFELTKSETGIEIELEDGPTQVKNLTGKLQDDGTVELDWDSVDDAEYYFVYRNTEADFETADRIGDVEKTDYDDSSLEDGSYYYWVEAYNSDGLASPISESAKVTVD